MSKVIKVFVVDNKGNGLSGQRVKTYGGAEKRTDANGAATVVVESGNLTLFVNGFQAFSGPSSRLGSEEVFSTTGGRP